VTAQRLLEEQLRQAQKLESVGRLAGGVAHDFNNLLTVILSCSDVLKEDLAGQTGAEAVEEIRAAGERARDLTSQILAFARKQVIVPVALDLNAVVRSSQKLLTRLLGEDIELRVNLRPALWTIHADLGQVEQVIVNLAVNARDAMLGARSRPRPRTSRWAPTRRPRIPTWSRETGCACWCGTPARG
jgi:signal transduction histidine kinase